MRECSFPYFEVYSLVLLQLLYLKTTLHGVKTIYHLLFLNLILVCVSVCMGVGGVCVSVCMRAGGCLCVYGWVGICVWVGRCLYVCVYGGGWVSVCLCSGGK